MATGTTTTTNGTSLAVEYYPPSVTRGGRNSKNLNLFSFLQKSLVLVENREEPRNCPLLAAATLKVTSQVDTFIEKLYTESILREAKRIIEQVYGDEGGRKRRKRGEGKERERAAPIGNGTFIKQKFIMVQTFDFEALKESIAAQLMIHPSNTRLMHWKVPEGEEEKVTAAASHHHLSTFNAKLMEILKCPIEISWNVEEIQNFILSKGITTIIILVSKTFKLSTRVMKRLISIMSGICHDDCSICWIVDDLGPLTRLPLPEQMTLNLFPTIIQPCRPKDIILDIIGELLCLEMIPSIELTSLMSKCSQKDQLKLLLRLSILEHSKISLIEGREECLSINSFQPRKVEEKDSQVTDDANGDKVVKEKVVYQLKGKSLDNAHALVRQMSAVWMIIIILRELFQDEFSTIEDLSRNLFTLHGYVALRMKSLFNIYHKGKSKDRIQQLKGKISLFWHKVKSLPPPPSFTNGNVDAGDTFPPGHGPFELLLAYNKDDIDIDDVRIDDFFESFMGNLTEWTNSQLPSDWTLIPLHESVTLSAGRATLKLLNPRILETFQLALEHSEFYIDGEDVTLPKVIIGSNTFTTTIPPIDTAVIFQLAFECGKFINTFDWFVSFRESVDPKRIIIPESDLMLRFLRSVHELQLMGFITPTKKRQDHYERLIVFHRTLN